MFSSMLTFSMIILAISIFPVSSSQSSSYPSVTSSGLFTMPVMVFVVLLGLVNVVGPLMLWYSWRWKTRRGGGWEVAKVRLRRARPGQG